MSCRKIKNKLVLLLDGDLSPSESDTVREHLRSCEACREEAELLRSSLGLVLDRAREKNPPAPPENFVSLFWQRERQERLPAGRAFSRALSSLRRIRLARYAPVAVSAVLVIAIVVLALLREGKPPSEDRVSKSPEDARQQEPGFAAEDRLTEIERKLQELEVAVRRLTLASETHVTFTGDETREVYAAIGLAAANTYRDVLEMNDLAAKRYFQVASEFPETKAGREAKEILSRLN